MSIVPASRLSASDLALLGNNLASGDDAAVAARRRCPRRRRRRLVLAGVNRSLALVGERIGRLYRPDPLEAAAAR